MKHRFSSSCGPRSPRRDQRIIGSSTNARAKTDASGVSRELSAWEISTGAPFIHPNGIEPRRHFGDPSSILVLAFWDTVR